MPDAHHRVVLEDSDLTLSVRSGTTLLQALVDADVMITHECGGNGVCGTCRVWISEGLEAIGGPGEAEKLLLKRWPSTTAETRLSCRVKVHSDLRCRIRNE